MSDDGARQLKPAARVDDEMSSTPFVRIRCLAGQNGLELGLGHARARQSARALDGFRGANHDHQINIRFPAGLEQQRHVDDNEPTARSRRPLQELNARLRHCRMHETFKPLQRLCVHQHPRSKALAIDLA